MIGKDPTPSPASMAWHILAESAPVTRRRCPHCQELIEPLDPAFGPENWCAVCWFVDGPYDAAPAGVAA